MSILVGRDLPGLVDATTVLEEVFVGIGGEVLRIAEIHTFLHFRDVRKAAMHHEAAPIRAEG